MGLILALSSKMTPSVGMLSIIQNAAQTANVIGVCQIFGSKRENKTHTNYSRTKISYKQTTLIFESVSRCHDLEFLP